MDQRQVDLLHAPSGELGGELAMRGIVLGDQQDAAGIPVQPVDDARPERTADSRERLEPMQQRVDQGAGVDAGAGVDHHSGGLIHSHEVLVFIKDRQRDVLRSGVQGGRLGGFQFDDFGAANHARGAFGRTVHKNAPALDPFLYARPAELRKPFVQHLVQPFAGIARFR